MDKKRIITIKIRQKVLSFFEGQHRALKFGEEDDLKNIREYTYGDNVKRINWIITAKEKKPYIVEREERKSQNIIVVLLLDQEMLYENKIDKLVEVYSIIGFSALYQKDKLYTYILTDRVETFIKHRNSFSLIDDAVDEILNLELKNKKLNLKELERYLLKHKRSYVILIGDFVYPVDLTKISGKHKIAIIKIRDRTEENPEKFTGYQLKSFDEKRKIPYLIKPMVNTYRKNLKEIDEKLRQFTVLKRIPVKTIYTDEDPFLKLRLMFS
ncbi:Protein of unknown function DUF58 [Persephonella hydrogeniphila]|uniref:DUF58 domain-containing protein n=1 Tax=Persephonella hydrogeniphila TaxID=198703 RepID=A0A285N0K5_9AQUI|nr:DUF58 domain-containing protein [Persephonella hydrogeniphila]SNZ02979.1 Protein of unknown function DUF58 [Persephonella hydrogeniphila]